MSRVTVYHLTKAARLPLIEEFGLRTRADMSATLGPVGEFDLAAPGLFANGRRVSGWLDIDQAISQVKNFGVGLVSFTLDPAKAMANSASLRKGNFAAYWAAAKPLRDWLEHGEVPTDLEVHQPVPVRAKHVKIHSLRATDEDLGEFAPLIGAVADNDRLSGKTLMHLAIIASEGNFESDAFTAACALAWRDEPDPATLMREMMEIDPDKIASAALAEYATIAPQATTILRQALESTRQWAAEQGIDAGPGMLERSGEVLDRLDRR